MYQFKLEFENNEGRKLTDCIKNFTEDQADKLQGDIEKMLSDHFHATAERGYAESFELFQLFCEKFTPGSKEWEFLVVSSLGKVLGDILEKVVSREIAMGIAPQSIMDQMFDEDFFFGDSIGEA